LAKANPFRFSTKYQDDETDLLYYGYRYYNPSTGRWVSRDPISERGGVNLYSFIANNPVSRFDSRGLSVFSDWFCCKDMCPDGAIKDLNAEFKVMPYGHTPASGDRADASAKAVSDLNTANDIIGYLTDPIGTIASNSTFHLGDVDQAINAAMGAQSTMEGVWLFIRFTYQVCESVRCKPKFWRTHLNYVPHGPTSWARATIGQDQGLDAFTDATDVDNNLDANIDAAMQELLQGL